MTSLQALNAKPLKCILTNNRKSIELLSSTGSLIVYEPSPLDTNEYRELYLANKFLAGGYGAKSIAERNTLSYIAENYEPNINLLVQQDNDLNAQISYAYSYLDNKKVDSFNGESSYTLTRFNDNENDFVYVKDLVNIFSNLPTYHNLEITSVEYKVTVNGQVYSSNNINIPIGLALQAVSVTIKGNTRNSGGIEAIDIKLNGLEGDENNIHIKEKSILGKFEKDRPFDISFSKIYDRNIIDQPIIKEGINKIFDYFIITVAETPRNEYLYIDTNIAETFSNRPITISTGAIKQNTIEIDPLIINGVYPLYYIFNNLYENADINDIHMQSLVSYSKQEYSPELQKNQIILDNNEINLITIYIPEQYKIINATYLNTDKNCLTNVFNYKAFNIDVNTGNNITQKIINSVPCNQYTWYIGDNIDNDFTLSIINSNNYFSKGILYLDVIVNDKYNVNEFNDDYLSNNWLSDDEIQRIFPVS